MEIWGRTDCIGISLMFVFRSVSFGAPSPSSPQSKCIDDLLHGLTLGWACYMSLPLFATTAQTPEISTLWFEGIISKHTLEEEDNPNSLRLLYSEINTRQNKWLKMKSFSLLQTKTAQGGLCAHQEFLVFFSCSIQSQWLCHGCRPPLYPVGAEAWPRCLLLR